MRRMRVLLYAALALHNQSLLPMNLLANSLRQAQAQTARSVQIMTMSVAQRERLQHEMRLKVSGKNVDPDAKTITYYINSPFLEKNRRIILRIGDITKLNDVDAIVNAANAQLSWGSGVCGAIFKAAGREQLEQEVTEALNGRSSIAVGQAVITPIPVSTASLYTINNTSQHVRYVIHAVGPDCRIVEQAKNAPTLLANAYKNSIAIADTKGVKRIAFPAISTAIFKCPSDQAAQAAIDAILDSMIATNIEAVNCVFLKEDDNYKEYIKILDQKLGK